jgi:hypothetical protein
MSMNLAYAFKDLHDFEKLLLAGRIRKASVPPGHQEIAAMPESSEIAFLP